MMSGKDVLIIILILSCMGLMGFLRTRKLVSLGEEKTDDKKSNSRTDE